MNFFYEILIIKLKRIQAKFHTVEFHWVWLWNPSTQQGVPGGRNPRTRQHSWPSVGLSWEKGFLAPACCHEGSARILTPRRTPMPVTRNTSAMPRSQFGAATPVLTRSRPRLKKNEPTTSLEMSYCLWTWNNVAAVARHAGLRHPLCNISVSKHTYYKSCIAVLEHRCSLLRGSYFKRTWKDH